MMFPVGTTQVAGRGGIPDTGKSLNYGQEKKLAEELRESEHPRHFDRNFSLKRDHTLGL